MTANDIISSMMRIPVTNVDKMNPKSDSNEGMIQFNITIDVNKYYQLVKCITA